VESDLSDVAIVNNEQAHRFEATIDGWRALITYRRFPGKIIFDHAEVPPPLEGKGLAAKLTRAALEFARAHGLCVLPACPYVAAYVQSHPEVQDLLAPDERQRIQSQSTNAASE
jgi:uncharacterized protein